MVADFTSVYSPPVAGFTTDKNVFNEKRTDDAPAKHPSISISPHFQLIAPKVVINLSVKFITSIGSIVTNVIRY